MEETQEALQARIDAALAAINTGERFTVRRLSAAEVKNDKPRIARYVAGEIRRQARRFSHEATPPHVECKEGDAPLNAMELHRAAVAMTLHLTTAIEDGHDIGAAYIPEEEASCASIVLSKNAPMSQRKREMAHEMGHHIVKTKVADALYNADVVECPELCGEQFRHELCSDVERELVYGALPQDKESDFF